MLVLRSNDYYCLNACISLGDVIIIVKLLVKCVTNEPCSVTSCESLLCSLLFQYALSALWACASYNGTSTQAVGATTASMVMAVLVIYERIIHTSKVQSSCVGNRNGW